IVARRSVMGIEREGALQALALPGAVVDKPAQPEPGWGVVGVLDQRLAHQAEGARAIALLRGLEGRLKGSRLHRAALHWLFGRLQKEPQRPADRNGSACLPPAKTNCCLPSILAPLREGKGCGRI